MSREDAYKTGADATPCRSGRARATSWPLLKNDPAVRKALSAKEIEENFDLGHHLKHVDTIFKRVFGKR